MEGIQLLGVPSMNLKPGMKRCAQNIGTSGSEIRKPPSAKRFAIQRIASLFSLGTSRRISAPTSGVKRMIESMWFCMKFSVVVRGVSLAVARACCPHRVAAGRRHDSRRDGGATLVVHVIEHEPY